MQVMSVRGVPDSAFGIGTPIGYTKLSCFSQVAGGEGVMFARGAVGEGVSATIMQTFVFEKNDSFNSARAALHVEIVAKRSLVKDNVVVRGVLEISRVEADVCVPHIVWLKLHSVVDKHAFEPDPTERLRPIVSSSIIAKADLPHQIAAAVDATSQVPVPPPAPIAAVLLQVLYTRTNADVPVFFDTHRPSLSRAPSVLVRHLDSPDPSKALGLPLSFSSHADRRGSELSLSSAPPTPTPSSASVAAAPSTTPSSAGVDHETATKLKLLKRECKSLMAERKSFEAQMSQLKAENAALKQQLTAVPAPAPARDDAGAGTVV